MYKLESRWNKRGIKKCPKCGTFNGNRAISCKNRTCQQALSRRRPDPIKNGHFGAVQIKHALEQTVKIYSIRKLNGTKLVRGFVEIRDCMDKVQDQLLQLKTAICYVDCQPHADQEGTCQHVRVASVTQERAEEMAFDSGNLQKLNINTAIRDAILKQQLKCRSEETPLVQKVSADTFVVRCDDKHHPSVPFCHVQLMYPDRIIYDCQVADNEEESTSCHHAFVVAAAILSTPKYYPVFKEIIDRFVISSDVPQEKFVPSEISVLNGAIFLTSSPTITDNSSQDIQNSDKLLLATIEKSDIQLIDCNLAFQSELGNMCFAGPGDETPARVSPIIELVNSNENSICGAEAFAADYEDNLQLMDCQIELMDQFSLTDRIDFCPSDVELSDDNLVTDKCLDSPVVSSEHLTETVSSSAKQSKPKLLEITTKKGALKQSAKVAKEKLKKGSYNVRRLMKILESNGVVFNRLKRSRAMELAAAEDRPLSAGTLPSYEATVCNLSFTSWLEHVIEQLNSVMEYDGDGKPPPQVFSIHEVSSGTFLGWAYVPDARSRLGAKSRSKKRASLSGL
ncbi:uncharacterized protein LOC128734790 isoform X2 [Sabethes cyaneus]|uniref:uncharacterized protein LOC128734790 isoform X2 n=1 Tax=Sabethes cyaneus TaxID=53552 RepID=UPI00237D705F|nr:uncharacterized protein LOC128734790 isoform X2 [Sabethes cyaneus]